jgi:E3 ubiquitin-protein ligase RNF5
MAIFATDKKDDAAAEREGVGGEGSTFFECNICIDQAKDPVVTQCGHLFCWPCLYRWMRVQNECHSCPVCKAGVEADKVIPLYGRGCEESDPRKKAVEIPTVAEEAIPRRPMGLRPMTAQRATNPEVAYNVQLGLGMFPSIFGHQAPPAGANGQRDPMTPEQQHQAFLSRLLLMIGSFCIMCLLLL